MIVMDRRKEEFMMLWFDFWESLVMNLILYLFLLKEGLYNLRFDLGIEDNFVFIDSCRNFWCFCFDDCF